MNLHGRSALALLAASIVAAGCGAERAVDPDPATIQIIERPEPSVASPAPERRAVPRRRARPGKTRAGTYTLQPRVRTPAAPAAPVAARTTEPVPARSTSRRKGSSAAFRRAHLRALRAHCRTRPADDPRCTGSEVDERVAFAAFDAEPAR